MCWGYMGGSVLAVGGGAPLPTAPITAKPDPIAPDSHPSTMHAGPHLAARRRLTARRRPRAWSPLAARHRPRVRAPRPRPRVAGCSRRYGSARKRTEAQRMVCAWSRLVTGKRTEAQRFVRASSRHGTVSTGQERQDAARTRQDAPGSTRTGRGYARSIGRQDATGAKLRARGRSVHFVSFLSVSPRTRKSPGHPSMPGLRLSRLDLPPQDAD